MERISETGVINEGGKLLLPMNRINQFLARHKGMRVLAEFKVYDRGSTELQQAYYYNYVLPSVVDAVREQGTRMTKDEADGWLVQMLWPRDTEAERGRELSKAEMSDFLDWLKEFAAENLEIFIEDPRTL